MKSEHISIKKMAIPFLFLAIASQAAGCGSPNQNDIQNTEVVLELPDLGKLELTPEERAQLEEEGISWGDSPAPIYMVEWDYETDWKEIFEKSKDDYQLELQYCEEKCPEKVMLASYLEGYFNWKDEYVANQVRPEVNNNPSSEKPKQAQENTQAQTSKPASSKPQTQTSKPQTSQPSNSSYTTPYTDYVEPDCDPISSGNIKYVYEERNPDGTTPGELTDGTIGNDYSGITVE